MRTRLIILLLVVVAVLGYEPVSLHAGPREDMVHGFYREVLGRTPDPAGSVAWASYLGSHCNADGIDTMSRGFMDSEEFRSRPYTLSGLVTMMYRTFLGREPDPAGMAAWAQVLRAARLDMAANGFLSSSEFQNLVPDRTNRGAVTGVVRRFYTQILARDPEPAGLSGWVDYIITTKDLSGAAAGFLASPEFEAKPMTYRGYVTILYRAFLGREPEPQGLQAWEAVLRAHMFSLIDRGFLPSKEFKEREDEVCEQRENRNLETALVRCADVNQPVALGASCGTDPLAAGRVEIGEERGAEAADASEVEVKVQGAAANASYTVVFRSLSGSTATERMLGTLTTNAVGNGALEVEHVFAVGDTGSGSVVLKRNAKDQFVSGFKVGSTAEAKLEAALVRCQDVKQPTTLSGCGTDPLAAGEAEIDAMGDVEVKVSGAAANASYRVVFRSLTGSAATERVVGTLMTNADGAGALEVENFFAAGDTGSGNVVLERSGLDQFVTGFTVAAPQDDVNEDERDDMDDR